MGGVRRYVLTGAPGSGKTSILRVLDEKPGYAVVEEAATDVIAHEQALGNDEPWKSPGFIETILAVQRRRQEEGFRAGAEIQVYDRSPMCTLALARYLDHPVPAALTEEVERIARERIYERRVFLVRPIGFIEPTAARRISFDDSLTFERLHQEVYLSLGYELLNVPMAEVAVRAGLIDSHIRSRP